MTTSTLTPAALDSAWTKLTDSERQLAIARAMVERHPGGQPKAERLLDRKEAAKRMGYSRSWLFGFLRNHWDDIPEHLRPDRQCASNRICVGFVEWFNTTGHRLPRSKAKPSPVTTRAAAPQGNR